VFVFSCQKYSTKPAALRWQINHDNFLGQLLRQLKCFVVLVTIQVAPLVLLVVVAVAADGCCSITIGAHDSCCFINVGAAMDNVE